MADSDVCSPRSTRRLPCARAGANDAAMAWLNRAIDDGFDGGALLDGEPDLASLRGLPNWPATRSRVR